MKLFLPRRATGLPPGQRLLRSMPRFSDRPLRPPPTEVSEVSIDVSVRGELVGTLTTDDFARIGFRNFTSDFHCVTGWSVKGLNWRGVPLDNVLSSVGLSQQPAPYVGLRAADGGRATFTWEDATASSVILATHLNGEPLLGRHGGPMRLVAPHHYGYKSLKHLESIDLRDHTPRRPGKMHLRGRVEHRERHPSLPPWLVLPFYRLTVAPTAAAAEWAMRRRS